MTGRKSEAELQLLERQKRHHFDTAWIWVWWIFMIPPSAGQLDSPTLTCTALLVGACLVLITVVQLMLK